MQGGLEVLNYRLSSTLPIRLLSKKLKPNLTNILHFPRSNRPPVILLIPALQHYTACLLYILLKLSFLVQVVVPLKRPVGLFTALAAFQNPRNHYILLIAFIPPSSAALLLQRPHVYKGFAISCFLVFRGGQRIEYDGDGLDAAFGRGEMVNYSN